MRNFNSPTPFSSIKQPFTMAQTTNTPPVPPTHGDSLVDPASSGNHLIYPGTTDYLVNP